MAVLFGGAMHCHIPPSFLDISTLRQVPDNQEVWADNDSDSSLIIELLQIPESSSVLPAIYHYNELAEFNSAQSSSTIMDSSPHSGPISYLTSLIRYRNASYSIVHGQQQISKYNYKDDGRERPVEVVDIFLCVVRIEKVATDITISLNVPEKIGVGKEDSKALFERIVASLEIVDWGLFSE
jgi:hypothetical protein